MTDRAERPVPARRRFSLWMFAPLIVFGALAVLFYVRLGAGDSSRIPSALIGKPVPDFSLPAIEGASVPGFDSSILSEGVTVVNVWASWCVPCRAEHPFLMELATDPRIRMAGINQKDVPANARRFLASLGDPYDVNGADRSGRVTIDWGVYGVPESFIVKDGIIVHKFIGPLSESSLKSDFLPAIESAFAD